MRKLTATWALTRFKVSVVTIEMDCIKARALPHIKVMTFGADSDSQGEDNTTPNTVVSVDDRTLRSCGINAVCMAMAVLSNDNHRRVLIGSTGISNCYLAWHQEESQECRNTRQPAVVDWPDPGQDDGPCELNFCQLQ